MACHLLPSVRDVLVRTFRAEVYRKNGFVEFPPQAEMRLATEGYELTKQVVDEPRDWDRPINLAHIFNPESVRVASLAQKPVRVMIPASRKDLDSFQIGETDNYARYQWQLAVPRRHLVKGPDGQTMREGVVAHKASMLASFKNGKSKAIGMWLSGFACVPGATIDLVGLQYGTSEHEFNYLCEALLSGEKPIIANSKLPGRKNMVKHHYNDVKSGRMLLELTNECSFGVRSWSNKDALRGGQITVYAFNEIYQLPGLQVYTGHAQNLRVEQGFAVFTSTPDRPWVKVLHQMAHGKNHDWFCTCGNDASVNPFAFDLNAFMLDAPDWQTIRQYAPALYSICERSGLQPGSLMSQEKFLISWLGQMGGFVGRVYSFNKEQITCYPHTHPQLWKPAVTAEWLNQREQIDALREVAQSN